MLARKAVAGRAAEIAELAERRPLPMSVPSALLHFGLPTMGLLVATRVGIPALMRAGLAPMLAWYGAGLAVFVPLFVLALVRTQREVGPSPIAMMRRLWLRRPSLADLAGAGAALFAVVVTSGLLFGGELLVCRAFGLSESLTQPPFLRGLDVGRGTGTPTFVVAWAFFLFFNIAGEELFWRGYILPRQEQTLGRRAWLVNGALWSLFHVPFGAPLWLLLSPLFLLGPWLVQRRRNVWMGILVHGAYNGIPSFLIASGLLR
jgi:membrane protease YdiL (CAAX protease family)